MGGVPLPGDVPGLPCACRDPRCHGCPPRQPCPASLQPHARWPRVMGKKGPFLCPTLKPSPAAPPPEEGGHPHDGSTPAAKGAAAEAGPPAQPWGAQPLGVTMCLVVPRALRGSTHPRGCAPWGAVYHRGPLCPGIPCTLGSSSVLGSCVPWGGSLHPGGLCDLGGRPCTLGSCVPWGLHALWGPQWDPPHCRSQAAPPSPHVWDQQLRLPHWPHWPRLARPRGRCFAAGQAMDPIGIVKGTIKRDAAPVPRQSPSAGGSSGDVGPI